VIAVLGAGGQLGSAFVRLLPDDTVAVTRAELDLSRPDQIDPWISATRPELVINCVAYTAVDAAEEDPEEARLVNATAVGRLAESTATHGIGLVTFSTDYVFDGTKPTGYVESDLPHPLNVYGSTKLEGEELVTEAHPSALVVRTSWVLSGTHRNFASTMLDLISKGPVGVVDDQHGRPTLVDDLAAATMAAVTARASGVLHLANQGKTTWCGLAREVAEIAGLNPSLVTPITTEEFPRPARRPANSVLNSERVGGLGLTPLPHYRPALENAVRRMASWVGSS
jgi:dTDP-4-dehydrorhamnose reductase